VSDHMLFFGSTFSRLGAPQGAEPSLANMDKHARNVLKSVSEVTVSALCLRNS
jgi:hypothetical protein